MNLKPTTKNILWLFGEKIVRFSLGLTVSALVARYLGVEKFGIWSFALTIVTLINIIPYFGLDNIIIKKMSQDDGESSELIANSITLKFVLSGIATLLTILIGFYHQFTNPDLFLLLVIMSIVFFFKPFDVFDQYFQSKVLSKYVVISKIVGFTLSSLLKILFVFYSASIFWFSLSYLAEFFGIAALLFFFYFIKNKSDRLIFNWNKKLIKDLIKESYPLVLSTLAVWIYLKVDQLMIKELLDYNELGYYSVAVRMSEATYFLPTIIVSTFFPKMAAFAINDKKKFEEKFKRLVSVLIYASLTTSFLCSILSPLIIKFCFGEQYNNSIEILKIHFWSLVFVSLGTLMSRYYIINGLQKYVLLNTTVGCVINILLNLLLIPELNGLGAAITTLISYSISSFILVFCFKETRAYGMIILRSLLSPITFN